MHLIVVSRFTHANGIGLAAVRMAEDLADLGHQVQVLAGRADYLIGPSVLRVGLRLPYSLEWWLLGLVASSLVRLTRARAKGVVVHSFEVPMGPKTCAVLHVHGDPQRSKAAGSLSVRGFGRNLARRGLQRLVQKHAAHGTPTTVPSASLGRRIARGSFDEFVVLPNALPSSDPLLRVHAKKSASAGEDPLRIGMVAQGDLHYKGVPVVGTAIADARRAGIAIILEVAGVDQASVDAATGGNLGVTAVGALNREAYSEWLSSLDAVVVASEYESFSYVALEALTIGVPVVCLGEVGIAEFLTLPHATASTLTDWLQKSQLTRPVDSKSAVQELDDRRRLVVEQLNRKLVGR